MHYIKNALFFADLFADHGRRNCGYGGSRGRCSVPTVAHAIDGDDRDALWWIGEVCSGGTVATEQRPLFFSATGGRR
ncbi:hypothetical protein Ptc2401_00782 [Prosthecochloris sp. CIB 2401]|nr:hypothetical protein Ptc2401_00782 [Prosthecochloris sp. CIB 2401]